MATAPLGDPVRIRSVRIEKEMLLVSVVRAGKDDPICCPGELADLGWALAGSRLEPVAVGSDRPTLAGHARGH
jgi:hypothetical protein